MLSLRLSTLVLAAWLGRGVLAQCGPVISTFPYAEGFETDAAWTSGGLNNDWEWGTPAHPLIDAAGGGAKSWCVGGLSGQFYEFDAQSWLMSPCFDFTTLDNPWISFKIFWEVERTYDGMVLQYSLDEGSTWENVGAYNDPENCLDQNWYNTSNIINLDEASPKHGWSGRQGVTAGSCEGGQGSGGWVTASHCLGQLANMPSVRFRFLFGSGSTCNNYDGVAIDDIFIGQAVLPDVTFSYTCDATMVEFLAETDCDAALTWDFGDPGSGPENSATGTEAFHEFTAVGIYSVSVSQQDPCGGVHVQSFPITVLGLGFISTPATCNQANGALESVVTGGGGGYSYLWSGGETTADLSGILPGIYTLTVTAPDACTITLPGLVENDASVLSVQVTGTDVSCVGYTDGSATAAVSGSTAMAFLWSPTGGDQAEATDLAAGDYTVTVTGDNGCEVTGSVTIGAPAELVVAVDPEIGICAGASVTLEAEANGGTGAYELTWSPAGPEVAPGMTTVFSVTATDANGCVSNTASTTVNVGAAIIPALTVDEPTGCAEHCVLFSAGPAGMASYAFDYGDGGTGAEPAHCYPRPGIFDVGLTVTDDLGCSGSAVFPGLVAVLPSPSAGFTAPSTVIVSDGPLQLIDASSGATSWRWDFDGAQGEDSVRYPVVTFPDIACYTLRQLVTNGSGCTDSSSTEVCVENEYALFAPNAFTPNGDGFNEVFKLVCSVRAPVSFVFRVFDRWGTEVFTTEDPDEGWSGANAENGLYAWNVELRDSERKLRKASGHVVLIR